MKIRRRAVEAIAEQLELVEADECEIHISSQGARGLRMVICDRWGIDHLEIGPDGLVTKASVGERRRA